MKCKHCQRRLLLAETPERPAPEVEAHLAGCSACREWQRRLVRIEVNVPRLPVPRSTAKAKLLQRILNPATADQSPTLPLAPLTLPLRPPARSWNWRLLAGGAAAAVLLIACGIWLGNLLWQAVENPQDQPQAQVPEKSQAPSDKDPKKPPNAPDTLVARLIKLDIRLARASSPQERVEVVAELADKLQGETRILVRAAGTKELAKLAQLYGKVVRNGVVPRSRALPVGERRKILAPIVAGLVRAEEDAEQLARKTPASAKALHLIAAAAREGKTQLRDLMGKDT